MHSNSSPSFRSSQTGGVALVSEVFFVVVECEGARGGDIVGNRGDHDPALAFCLPLLQQSLQIFLGFSLQTLCFLQSLGICGLL